MKHDAIKFIGFFNLMEAMKKAGCPVCIRILEETHRFMNSFLCESVNDARLRDEICRDRGLCHRHSWQLALCGEALGGPLIFREVLESAIPDICPPRPPFSLSRQSITGDVGRKPCLFCRLERQSHDAVISHLINHLADPELVMAWDGPAALCVPHLTEVCAGVERESERRSLIGLHHAKYQRLCDEMSSLIEKQRYSHRLGEIRPEESDSWTRAIEMLVGRPGVH
jgi:hypothetical protein